MKAQFVSKLWTALFGVVALLLSPELMAQVKIGTNPTTIGADRNFEIEATNGSKTSSTMSTGTFKVENKPMAPKTDSLVMRDANGELHQMSGDRFMRVNSPLRMFSTVVPETFAAAFAIEHPVNFTTVAGNNVGNWNSTTREFTVTKAGYYKTTASIGYTGASSATVDGGLFILRGGTGSIVTFSYANNFTSSTGSTVIAYCAVGTKISLAVQMNSGQNLKVTSGNLTIEEIPY